MSLPWSSEEEGFAGLTFLVGSDNANGGLRLGKSQYLLPLPAIIKIKDEEEIVPSSVGVLL
jgi:hypothetical protein